MKSLYNYLTWKLLFLLVLGLVAGCAGSRAKGDYVEVPNPALTMSPNAPEKIWVLRSSVDNGIPRGGELAKRGYETVKDGLVSQPTGTQGVPTVTAPQAGIVSPGAKPAAFIARYGMVVAVDGDKVYFNLGRESGITPFQTLKVYRGGTVVEGLGLAPGEFVATIEVQGLFGTSGGYALVTKGRLPRINDLVGAE